MNKKVIALLSVVIIIISVIAVKQLSWKYSVEGWYTDGEIYLDLGPHNTFIMMCDRTGNTIMSGRYKKTSRQFTISFTKEYKEMIEGFPEFNDFFLSNTINAEYSPGTIILPWPSENDSNWEFAKVKQHPTIKVPNRAQ